MEHTPPPLPSDDLCFASSQEEFFTVPIEPIATEVMPTKPTGIVGQEKSPSSSTDTASLNEEYMEHDPAPLAIEDVRMEPESQNLKNDRPTLDISSLGRRVVDMEH